MAGKYHAVSIKHSAAGCRAAKAVGNVRFLSNEAPLIPLPGCNTPKSCRCRYEHYPDRRDEPRRDSDVGLPGMGWYVDDRRHNVRGRRANDR